MNSERVRGRIGREDGFTIVEAMIALVILSFAILGIFKIHLSAVKIAAFNDHVLNGVLFARSKVESLKSLNFSGLTNGSGSDATTDTTPPVDYKGGNGKFKRQWTISDVPNLSQTKQIIVKVGWNTQGDCTAAGNISSCNHVIEISSYISAM